MSRETLGLAPFLEALERRLDALDDHQLRHALLAHAESLPAEQRAGFLAIFAPPASGRGQRDETDPTLIDDAEAFVADVAAGAYVDTAGFDPDYGEHRAFGDETWTIELDALLGRAGRALLAGEPETAREAYARLLGALDAEYDEGGFPGAGTPAELVDTDLDEAKHRYLRAVWEAEPLPSRAAALVEAAESLAYVGRDPSLAEVEATRREALRDVDAVLDDLIMRLSQRESAQWGVFDRQARRLLAEATERRRGVDGLADLARTPGANQAEAYRDWVDALTRAQRPADAEAAAGEALAELEAQGSVPAQIAERLAALARARGDDATTLEACQHSWRADPSRQRLLRLVDAADAVDRRDEALAVEADRAHREPLSTRPHLATAALALAGRVDDAVGLLDGADARWHDAPHRGHPATVVVPVLLVAASSAHHHDRWDDLLLRELLTAVDTIDLLAGVGLANDLDGFHRLLEPPTADDDAAAPQASRRLSRLLADAIDAHPPDREDRHRWLATARGHVTAHVDAVVGGKHRRAYPRAARLAAACAEAVALSGDEAAARALVEGLHAAYPRHAAFRRELRSAVAASPQLHA